VGGRSLISQKVRSKFRILWISKTRFIKSYSKCISRFNWGY